MSVVGKDGIYLGVMSGTSLDGLDAVAAEFAAAQPPRLLAHAHAPFDPALRAELLALNRPGADELDRAARAANGLADAVAEAIARVLRAGGLQPGQVRAAGVHGQTVRHRPACGYTIQLNAPARIAEAAGIAVVADFRSRDVAAGGQGAPLVPAFHAAVFAAAEPRAIVNLGGMANLTLLPGSAGGPVGGFDCGPGNVLLDLWAQRHLHQPMDRDGAWARRGRVDPALLERWRADEFLRAPPPKSTGRDRYNDAWLTAAVPSAVAPADVQATLVELTALAVVDAIAQWAPATARLIVCGGGAANPFLLERLRALAGGRPVDTTLACGIDPQHVEALAFAWLARACLRGEPASLPLVTGARGPRVLGAVYPA